MLKPLIAATMLLLLMTPVATAQLPAIDGHMRIMPAYPIGPTLHFVWIASSDMPIQVIESLWPMQQKSQPDHVSVTYISTSGACVSIWIDCTKRATDAECVDILKKRYEAMLKILPIDKAATMKFLIETEKAEKAKIK